MKKLASLTLQFAVVGFVGGACVLPSTILIAHSAGRISEGELLALLKMLLGVVVLLLSFWLPLYFTCTHIRKKERCPACKLSKNSGIHCKSCGSAFPNLNLALENVSSLSAAVAGGIAVLAQFGIAAYTFESMRRVLSF